jgi:hypothetical protein
MQNFYRLQDSNDGRVYKPIDPSLIPNDTNNLWSDFVRINVSLIDNYQIRVRISDANSTSYTVDENILPRPFEAFEARLTQVGFETQSSPFSFKLGNIYNKETLLTT